MKAFDLKPEKGVVGFFPAPNDMSIDISLGTPKLRRDADFSRSSLCFVLYYAEIVKSL